MAHKTCEQSCCLLEAINFSGAFVLFSVSFCALNPAILSFSFSTEEDGERWMGRERGSDRKLWITDYFGPVKHIIAQMS